MSFAFCASHHILFPILQLQMEDYIIMEAFESLLKVWITLLDEGQLFKEEYCKQASAQIFNTYLKSHLSPPDGNRGTVRIHTLLNFKM